MIGPTSIAQAATDTEPCISGMRYSGASGRKAQEMPVATSEVTMAGST